MTDNKKLSNYYKKASLYIKISKFAVILLFLIFALSCVFVFRKDITAENIQLLAKFISLDGASTHYTDEFSITAKDDSDVFMLRDNLAIVSNNNISLYDLSGHKMFSYNYSLSVPAASHDDHYILVYDIGGKEATVFNSFSKIKTMKFEHPIYAAEIKNDYIAFVTGNSVSRCQLLIYEFDNQKKDYVLVYSKNFNDFINSVSLSDGGRYAMVSSVSSKSGNYKCSLLVYDTESSSSDAVVSYMTNNELPIDVNLYGTGTAAFTVTDSSIIFLDKKFESHMNFKFNQSKVDNYYLSSNTIAITERNNLSGNSMKITLMTFDGSIIYECNVPDEVYDIALGSDIVYALGRNGVYKYSTSNETPEDYEIYPVGSKMNSIVCDTDNNCYLLSNTLFSKVTFSKGK